MSGPKRIQRKRTWLGWRIHGLCLLGRQWTQVHGYVWILASWHNPKHLCWLWSLEAYRYYRQERRFGYGYIPGHQARWFLSLWWWHISFHWQAEGWYRNSRENWTARVLKRLGMKL